ncbi:acetylornithine aminotransferase [Sporosarcina sp. NCCP-2222]|uniref:acetylornithine transaminase n=1 Tax=Sporosarcina sp. NCCP-2222 TaxID=2935073 RepID=UPI002086B698|nr:acetylornithine transaminase [Sporosarcina sp. NCCP-2222]GKV55865.1 acetylornithine aminotransferase [Sporosarcina sp. NCCP-2222]
MSHLFPNYARRPIHLVEGKGTVVTDSDGKSYLDFISGIAVNCLGHSHPALIKALGEQSQQLWHVSNLFESPEQERLAASILQDTHLSRIFFCNSGAEANEAAMKLARKYTGKHSIITFEHSFHGRTFGAMAATGQEKVKQGFGPMLPSFVTVPFNDLESLTAAATEEVAAIMLEVIQGEGGVNEITPDFAKMITDICHDKGILLIVDEVQTGIGRTGTRFAYEQTLLKPDILTLAKGLGGGFPIGAMAGTDELVAAFGPGTHGTTFGGNPLAVRVAQAVVDHIFDPVFLEEVNMKSIYLQKRLQEVFQDSPFQLRGRGLLVGVDCGIDVGPLIEELQESGLLAVQAGQTVIRLLPPLTVSIEEIDEAVDILCSVLKEKATVS